MATGRRPDLGIRRAFQSYPLQLRELLRISSLPKPDLDRLDTERVKSFSENNAQGVVFAHDTVWFLSSEKGVFRFAIDGPDPFHPSDVRQESSVRLTDLVQTAVGLQGTYDHIGDLAYHDGLVFAPIRFKPDSPGTPLITGLVNAYWPAPVLPHVIMALTEDLRLVGWAALAPSASDSLCAVHPWNGLLYVTSADHPGELEAYEIGAFLARKDSPGDWGQAVAMPPRADARIRLLTENGAPDTSGGIQGITFSRNGRLYLTRFTSHEVLWVYTYFDNYVCVYDSLTGIRLSGPKEIDFSGIGDEIEGTDVHPSGVLYVAVADNDVNTDEFELYAFRLRDLPPDAV